MVTVKTYSLLATLRYVNNDRRVPGGGRIAKIDCSRRFQDPDSGPQWRPRQPAPSCVWKIHGNSDSHVAFIDLDKTYVWVYKGALWKMLRIIGPYKKPLDAVNSFFLPVEYPDEIIHDVLSFYTITKTNFNTPIEFSTNSTTYVPHTSVRPPRYYFATATLSVYPTLPLPAKILHWRQLLSHKTCSALSQSCP